MKVFATIAVCAALAAAASGLCAAPSASTNTQDILKQDILKKGAIVRLRLETDLEAGRSKPGDPVRFTVDRDVYGSDGRLLLAKGMEATGKVTASTDHDRFGRRGQITFIADSIRTVDGADVPINLVVGSGSGAAADAADETDAQEFYSFRLETLDPDGYVQSANPDGYYTQPLGTESVTIYDPARQFDGDLRATVKHGELYTAHVSADTPVAPITPSDPRNF